LFLLRPAHLDHEWEGHRCERHVGNAGVH
jgi:hypothetical protein